MIEQLTKKPEFNDIVCFLVESFDYDFYITEQNIRLYMTDVKNVKKFLRQCPLIYTKKVKGDYKGIIGIWKSDGGGLVRYYVKLIAQDFETAKSLLTVLLWNTNKDLYVKIRKDSRFVSAFKNKGFRFIGGRGCQILLYRKYIKNINESKFIKEED